MHPLGAGRRSSLTAGPLALRTTVRWASPGAIVIASGGRAEPSLARGVWRPDSSRSCWAKAGVNEAGKCWVIRIGIPSPFGKAPNSWPIEWMPPVEAPMATTRARSRDGLPQDRRVGRGLAGSGLAQRPPAERADLGQQLVLVFLVEPAGRGLLQGVGRAERERFDGLLRAVRRQAGDDHDLGFAGALDQLRQRAEAADARHLEIEQDHVDPLARRAAPARPRRSRRRRRARGRPPARPAARRRRARSANRRRPSRARAGRAAAPAPALGRRPERRSPNSAP